MKPVKYFLLMLPFLLFSCGSDRLKPVFGAIDSLTQTHPDSAMALLEKLRPEVEGSNAGVKMYYRLLCTKAADKADRMKPDAAEAERIVEYFSSHDREHLPEALYYAGRTFRELNDAPQAREYFIRTIDIITEGHYAASDSYYRRKAYSQLGSIYIYQDMFKESAAMYGKSLEVSKAMGDTLGMVYNLRDLANAYYCMGNTARSTSYVLQARAVTQKMGAAYDTLDKELTAMLAANAYAAGQYRLAEQCVGTLLPTADAQMLIEAYTTAAPLYQALGKEDKSLEACDYLLAHGNLYDKLKAARIKTGWAMKRHNTEEAYSMMRHTLDLNDSVNRQRKTETLMRMNAAYNYNKKEKENMKLRTQKSTYRSGLVAAVGICLFLAVALTLSVRYSRQRHQFMKLKLAHYQQIADGKSRTEAATIRKEQDNVTCSEIYKTIRRRLNAPTDNKRLDDNEWQQLSDMLEGIYPLFHKRLFDLCKLNEHEYHVTLLIKVGLPPSAIATLTFHSRESVTATRRRLYEKAFGKKGTPKEWDDIIMSL